MKRWVVRDLINRGSEEGALREPTANETRRHHVLWPLLQEFTPRLSGQKWSATDHWTESVWEVFTLRALWLVCREGVRKAGPKPAAERRNGERPRDLLLRATGVDSDLLVHEFLIRFSAAFTDQEFAAWSLPDRDLGYYRCFLKLYSVAGGSPHRWLRGLAAELTRLQKSGIKPLESIHESLTLLGIPPEEWAAFLPLTLAALRGWASIIRQMEVRSDRVHFPVPTGTLMEFLAVRLILERMALAYVARKELGYRGDLSGLARAFVKTVRRVHPRKSSVPFPSSRSPSVLAGSRRFCTNCRPPIGRRCCVKSKRSTTSSVDASSTPASSGVCARGRWRRFGVRQEAAPCTRAAAVPIGLLHRRPRGIVPSAPRRNLPRSGDVRRGRLLRRADVLSGPGRRLSVGAVSHRRAAAALGDRGTGLSVRRVASEAGQGASGNRLALTPTQRRLARCGAGGAGNWLAGQPGVDSPRCPGSHAALGLLGVAAQRNNGRAASGHAPGHRTNLRHPRPQGRPHRLQSGGDDQHGRKAPPRHRLDRKLQPPLLRLRPRFDFAEQPTPGRLSVRSVRRESRLPTLAPSPGCSTTRASAPGWLIAG